MRETVNIRSYSVIIDAPAEVVFDFVNDLANLPRWAIHFCTGVRLLDNGAMVATPAGEVYFDVISDRDSGVIDWWSGPTMETAQRWPTRVVGLPEDRSIYVVTAILGERVPPHFDAWIAEELDALRGAVEEQLALAAAS